MKSTTTAITYGITFLAPRPRPRQRSSIWSFYFEPIFLDSFPFPNAHPRPPIQSLISFFTHSWLCIFSTTLGLGVGAGDIPFSTHLNAEFPHGFHIHFCPFLQQPNLKDWFGIMSVFFFKLKKGYFWIEKKWDEKKSGWDLGGPDSTQISETRPFLVK